MADRSVPSLDDIVKAGIPLGTPPRRKGNPRKRLIPYALSGPAVLWLVIFFLIPVVYMFLISLNSGLLGELRFAGRFANYSDVVKVYRDQFTWSIIAALLVTIITLSVAYPLAYWIAFYGGKRKSTYLFLLLLPFFVSFVIRTVQWQFILADSGVLFKPLKAIGLLPDSFRVLGTRAAVVAGIAYNYLPFTALPLYVSLERIDPKLLEAGRDLYANKATTFRKVVWPLSLPGVFAAFLLTFVPAVGDFVNAELLGGAGTKMIGNIIQSVFQTNFDYPHGAALSFILMVVLLAGASLYARVLGTDAVMRVARR